MLRDSSPVCLVYDTTFNLGDFYVSPLVFRHVLFEETPWIPLAFLIHDRKLQKCHNRLFEFIADKVPVLKSRNIPFITDREPALTKSVEAYFPNIQVFHCWNHIRRDFKEELRKQGADSSEMNLYLRQWKEMAQSESEEDFLNLYDDHTIKWCQSVKSYFDKQIKPDLLKYSGRWIIEKFKNLYDPYSGITNNPSESINSVLKRMTGWQELPVDVMMLSLYHLQNYYYAEIQRGRADIGNYHLKSRYRMARIDKDEVQLPNKILEPSDIIQYVKSVISDVVKSSNIQGRSTTIKEETQPDNDASERNESSGNTDNDSTSRNAPTSTEGLANVNDTPSSHMQFGSTTPSSTGDFANGSQSNQMQFNNTPGVSDSSNMSSPSPAPVNDKHISQKSLAKYVVDNKGVTHVPDCNAFVVNGNNNKKYCVTLNTETCQCPASTTCYHIVAVKMFVGLPIDIENKEVNLRSLSKRSLKRSDKKSGRKQPRARDVDPVVIPAPDSLAAQGPSGVSPDDRHISEDQVDSVPAKTPKSRKKLRFQDSPVRLPAKKRKMDFATSATEHNSTSEKWVGNLTAVHKRKIEDNMYICSDIMQMVQAILRRQFPDVNGMQATTNAPVWKDAENRWRNNFPFQPVLPPAAQIHHDGKQHWVTSVNINGEIHILDSLPSSKLTPSLEIQLTSLYSNGNKLLPVKIPSIQRQSNSYDCGLYAIANLVQFCYGLYTGKEEIKYNEMYMRDHLVYCLERQNFVPFPRIETKTKVNKRKPRIIDVQCDCKCGKPNCMEEMVGCDGCQGTCGVWRHRSCAVHHADSHDDWYCTPHRT